MPPPLTILTPFKPDRQAKRQDGDRSGPRDLPPDPRLPGEQPRYSRDNIVTALLSFYESLPHVDPSLIRRAPPGGWTEITPESLAGAKMRPAERVSHRPDPSPPIYRWRASIALDYA